MKLFNAMRQIKGNRVPSRIGRVQAFSDATCTGSMVNHDQWQVKHSVEVSFSMTGPEGALPEMQKRARKAIANEVFGEIENDLIELRKMLWEEDVYRGANDPVETQIETMLHKVRGEA